MMPPWKKMRTIKPLDMQQNTETNRDAIGQYYDGRDS